MGGTALKWLFGVSTQSDLIDLHTEMEKRGLQQQQIVHLIDKQVTIANQTQQIAHSSLLLIKALEKRSTLLQSKIDYVLEYIQHSELIHLQQLEYFAELDSTFASLDYVFAWFQQQLEAWEIGLATLANGRLSPQIISPPNLQAILVDINKQLPLGWKIPADDLWVLYREATVTAAVVRNTFRLFVEIPFYDHAQHFNLFKVIRLPKATENGTHGVRFSNLSVFLAVSPDLDTFIELQITEMQHCREFDKQLYMSVPYGTK
jgi:hypothetical protein